MTQKIIPLAFFFFSLSGLFLFAQEEPQNAEEFYRRGNEYHEKWNQTLEDKWANKAVADFTQAIQLDPSHAGAYFARGMEYFNYFRYELAIADLSEDIRLNPTHAEAYYWRGFMYHNRNEWEKAVEDFTQVIQLNPSNEPAVYVEEAYFRRGLTYHRNNYYENAIADYEEALRLDPTDTSTKRALAQARQQQPPK